MANADGELRAGAARADITPTPGTRMMGYVSRDLAEPAGEAHDPLYVRAVWLEQGERRVLILAYDTCFIQREEVDRFKGALGRVFGLAASEIFLNSSHTHTGASVGGRWSLHDFQMPERLHVREVEAATICAAGEARKALRPAEMAAGKTRCDLPMNRRRLDEEGHARFAPAPDGPTHDTVPVCMVRERGGGAPIATLFAASCHASTIAGHAPSADYPGVACAEIERRLGAGMAAFLQGCGGDSKARVIAEGDAWGRGDWGDVAKAGGMLADAVADCIAQDLTPVQPDLAAVSVEQVFPFVDVPTAEELEAYVESIPSSEYKSEVNRRGAMRLIEWARRGNALPRGATLTVHGVRLGEGLRLIGVEAETVAEWGMLIERFYEGGTTFALGYTNGAAAYLPVTRQLPERGYEVESWLEYGWAARFAEGIEDSMREALRGLRAKGIV